MMSASGHMISGDLTNGSLLGTPRADDVQGPDTGHKGGLYRVQRLLWNTDNKQLSSAIGYAQPCYNYIMPKAFVNKHTYRLQ